MRNIIDNNMLYFEKMLRHKAQQQKEADIRTLLGLVENNPDITEDRIRPDLRKYFGIAKREYIKGCLVKSKRRKQ